MSYTVRLNSSKGSSVICYTALFKGENLANALNLSAVSIMVLNMIKRLFCVYHECETHVHVCAWRRVTKAQLRLYLEMKSVQRPAKMTSRVLIVMLCYQHCQFQRLQRTAVIEQINPKSAITDPNKNGYALRHQRGKDSSRISILQITEIAISFRAEEPDINPHLVRPIIGHGCSDSNADGKQRQHQCRGKN
ncbi:conserved hypothetical protein [Trichinella spiralis]|uniref:hypothetical protein n=1 Tax=Trichinella spiralis TaxID=6334 RepID=UPI0001EFDDAE|nr:conserved hypothetical protein [Trichinella spiralis]